jgi:hypothetical protein
MRKVMRRTIVPFTIGAALTSGFAMAAWSPVTDFIAGGGKTAQAKHLEASAQVNDELWPGTCSGISFSLKNPNPRPIMLTSVGLNGSSATVVTPNTVGIEPLIAAGALAGEVIAAGETKDFTIPEVVCLDPNSPTTNQGKAFTVALRANFEIVPGNGRSDLGTPTPPNNETPVGQGPGNKVG